MDYREIIFPAQKVLEFLFIIYTIIYYIMLEDSLFYIFIWANIPDIKMNLIIDRCD